MFQLVEDDEVLYRVSNLVAARCFGKEEEQAQRKAYLAEVDSALEGSNAEVRDKKYLDLLVGKLESMLAVCNDDEIDSFAHAIAALLMRNSSSAASASASASTTAAAARAEAVIKELTNPAAVNPIPARLRRRLRCLVILLNVFDNTVVKYSALNTMLEYAKDHNAASLVVHFHSRIDDLINAWSLEKPQRRKLYQNMSTILTLTDQTSLALNFLIKYFKTFEGEKTRPAEVSAMAAEAVVSAVKSPVSAFSDRNALLVSFSGGSSLVEKALVELLKIMCSGSVQDFEQYEKSAEGNRVLTQYSINRVETVHKLRMMSFCAMGCEQNTIAYKDIAAKLGLKSIDEVQDWVVEAVSQGLMEAHMDELYRAPNGDLLPVVIVKQCAHRSFSKDQWVLLQGKLRHLKTNVSSVLTAISK